jgi:stage II sporulation protein AA (anti-sigma F factor antagonist)
MHDRWSPLSVELLDTESGLTVIVSGEIDTAAAPTFQAALDSAIEHGDGDVAIDMAAVKFLDASGLDVLARFHTALAEQGRRLRISALSTIVARVIEVAGMTVALRLRCRGHARCLPKRDRLRGVDRPASPVMTGETAPRTQGQRRTSIWWP